jgi:hypothetical protein
MENLNTSWLVVWPQIINKMIFVWGPMSSCVKPLRLKVGPRLEPFICFHSLFLEIIFLCIFASFFKLNPQNQITMDEHRHKILVFFMAISQAEKIKTPSIIHKQAHKFNERRGK